MIQIPCLLQVSARPALLQVPHALLERPESAQKVGAHGPLGEIEVGSDLLGAQPLLEAEGDRRPVLVW
jgi:hypothetical protein